MDHDYAVVEASIDHIGPMLENIRQADIDELWAAAMITPEQALSTGIKTSTAAWTGMVDGKPVCMFGVAPASLLGAVGVPWMLGTNDIDLHAKAFLRRNKTYVAEMLRLYNHLINFVDDRNTRAIGWLKWLGFEMDEPQPHGPFGVLFRRFEMKG